MTSCAHYALSAVINLFLAPVVTWCEYALDFLSFKSEVENLYWPKGQLLAWHSRDRCESHQLQLKMLHSTDSPNPFPSCTASLFLWYDCITDIQQFLQTPPFLYGLFVLVIHIPVFRTFGSFSKQSRMWHLYKIMLKWNDINYHESTVLSFQPPIGCFWLMPGPWNTRFLSCTAVTWRCSVTPVAV